MRTCALILLAGLACSAQDAREIIRRAVEADGNADAIARSYTFLERQDRRDLDASGREKRREIRTYDITLTEGTPYRRLVARNDAELSPAEQQQEQQKLEQSIAARRNESPEQRRRRLAEWEARRRRQREFLRELPDAFDFKVAGEQTVDGRPTWVIEASPRRGYHPKSLSGRFLPNTKATLWIDKVNYGCARLDAETVDTTSVGLILVRVYKGTRLRLEQTFVNNEVWLPQHAHLSAAGRIALFRRFASEWDMTYSNYRKFQADSRVVSYETNP